MSQISSDKKYVIREITVYQDDVTLSDIARMNKKDLETLKKLNPRYESGKIPIGIKIKIPNIISGSGENSEEGNGKHYANPLMEILIRISPKLRLVLDKIIKFHFDTREYMTNVVFMGNAENEMKALKGDSLFGVYTHCEVFSSSKLIKEKFKDEDNAYIKTQKDIYDKYEKALLKMGFIFRNLSLLYAFIERRDLFDIKNKSKIKDASLFIDHLLTVLLWRIDGYLAYMLHTYQFLNGTYHDYVIYEMLTNYIEITFLKYFDFFSDKGKLDEVGKYPYDFFPIPNIFMDAGFLGSIKCNFFEELTDRVDRNEKITDEYIFNYSFDYSGNTTREYFNNFLRALDKVLNDKWKDIAKNYDSRVVKLKTLYMGYYIKEIKGKAEETIGQINKIIDEYPQVKKLGYLDYIAKLVNDHFLTSINKAEKKYKNVKEWDQELQDLMNHVEFKYLAFQYGTGLFVVASQVERYLNKFDLFFVSEGRLYDDIKDCFDELLNICNLSDLEEAAIRMKDFEKKLDKEKYTDRAVKIIEDGKFRSSLAIELSVLAVVSVITWGAGAAVEGAASGLFYGSEIAGGAVTAASFATEVLTFTLTHELLSSFIEKRRFFDGKLLNFASSLTSTIFMMAAFKGVNKIFEKFAQRFIKTTNLPMPISKMGNIIPKFSPITRKLLVFAMHTTSNFVASSLLCAPFYAINLMSEGRGLGTKKEWYKFFMSQLCISTMFSTFGIVQGRMEALRSKIYSGSFKRSSKIKKAWEDFRVDNIKRSIDNEFSEIKDAFDKQNSDMRLNLELDKQKFNDITDQNKDIIDKWKNILKETKKLRKFLLENEWHIIKEFGSADIGYNGEITLIEHLLAQAKKILSSLKYPETTNAHLDIHKKIKNLIPSLKDQDFVTLGKDKKNVLVNLPVIIDDGIKLKKEGFRLIIPDSYLGAHTEGILKVQAEYTDNGKVEIAETTLIDLHGEGNASLIADTKPLKIEESKKDLSDSVDYVFPDPIIMSWKIKFGIHLTVEKVQSFAKKLNDDNVVKIYNDQILMEALENTIHKDKMINYENGNFTIEDESIQRLMDILKDHVQVGIGKLSLESISKVLQVLIYAHDPYTGETHSEQVPIIAEKIAKRINEVIEKKGRSEEEKNVIKVIEDLKKSKRIDLKTDDKDIEKIKIIGRVHDVGKIGIDIAIIAGSGITDEQFLNLQNHATISKLFLEHVNKYGDEKFDRDIIEGAELHHAGELEGVGYPHKNKEVKFSKYDIIISLADQIDAIVSKRGYKAAITDRKTVIKWLGDNIERKGLNAEIFKIFKSDKTMQDIIFGYYSM